MQTWKGETHGSYAAMRAPAARGSTAAWPPPGLRLDSEVFDGDLFSSVADNFLRSTSGDYGRRAAEVACRSLGFATGAQMLSGLFSALPGEVGDVDTIGGITCKGDEAALGDCEFSFESGLDYANSDEAVALVCTNLSGASSLVMHAQPSTGWQCPG